MNYEKDRNRAENVSNPNRGNRQDTQRGKNKPPLLDKEKNQVLIRDPDQHLIPHEAQNDDYNSPDGASNNSGNQENTRRKDKPFKDKRKPPGSYLENNQPRKAPSKEDLDENFPRQETDGDWRDQGNHSESQHKRRPLGSYQENYQSRKAPSKEDLDENFPRD